jgi:hypothetical protein
LDQTKKGITFLPGPDQGNSFSILEAEHTMTFCFSYKHLNPNSVYKLQLTLTIINPGAELFAFLPLAVIYSLLT